MVVGAVETHGIVVVIDKVGNFKAKAVKIRRSKTSASVFSVLKKRSTTALSSQACTPNNLR